ncbi:MAG: TerC family protein [Candidatus Aureabacteria bacterium]|nr:TerC family protein [Candidatus Auribacterota bacterium]
MHPPTHQILWIIFAVLVPLMLFLDLKVFHRKVHTVEFKEALKGCAFWIGLALLFNAGIYFTEGKEKALLFFTGYLVEESLSVDNLFVFLLIFSYFRLPKEYEHKVLFWGILGAMIMRAVFIVLGISLINRFHWIIYIFGAFLIYTGFQLFRRKEKEIHPEKNPIIRLLKKFMRITPDYEKDRFFIRKDNQVWATPLFVILLVVETTDVIFAVDSIPAILAITTDPFIVYTSNIFAILGLRALFFALSGLMRMFYYLHYGLSVILVFIGTKMLLMSYIKIPVGIALGVIASILCISVAASLILDKPNKTPHVQ